MNYIYILLFALFLFLPLFSQEDYYIQSNQKQFSSSEEYLEALAKDDGDIDDLLEVIYYYINNPVDLLHSNSNQISQIPGLSYFDAYSIYDCLKRDSSLSYDKICSMFKFNEYQRWILENCTVIGIDTSRIHIKVRERSSYQLERPVGYEKNKYVGEQWNLLQKYQLNYNTSCATYVGGAIINKNAGEKNVNEFMSGYIFVDAEVAQVIVGDFEIQTGMGNVFGESFKPSKGVNVINPTISFINRIRPYTSKMDYRVMRGVATRLDFPIINNINISSSMWYSDAPRSAGYNSKDSSYISSIFTSGYYRTETDYLKKHNITEKSIGGTIEVNGCNYNIGVLLTHFAYPLEIRSTAGRVFSGKEGYFGSLFGTFNFSNVFISGEISSDNNSNYAVKIGSAYKSKELDLAVQFRSFDEKYRSQYGSMFGEFSYPANEIGLYTGLIWRPNKIHRLLTFVDIFSSYLQTSTVDTIVSGFEIFGQYEYNINNYHSLTFRIDEENKTTQKTIDKIKHIYQKDDITFRIEYESDLTKNLFFRSRAELLYISNKNIVEDEVGFAFFIEGNYQVNSWFKVSGRTTIFSSESFTSAIWQFEYFYPGYSMSSSLYLDGLRSYLQIQFTINKMLYVYLRYENQYKPNETTLGSGNELINSNRQNRFYCQLDFRL
jgi:hypothetical protein